jgi:hypothetical protein
MKITHSLILGFALCFYSLFGVAMCAPANAGEYYIYRDSNGRLVISNKEPPSGSKIIRQRTLTDEPKIAVQDAPERTDSPLNERPDDSFKRSETK